MYFGEYPLSFAVCMEQPDMFRLLIAFKVNLNAQDTNGNTVCHLAVIHEKEVGRKITIDFSILENAWNVLGSWS